MDEPHWFKIMNQTLNRLINKRAGWRSQPPIQNQFINKTGQRREMFSSFGGFDLARVPAVWIALFTVGQLGLKFDHNLIQTGFWSENNSACIYIFALTCVGPYLDLMNRDADHVLMPGVNRPTYHILYFDSDYRGLRAVFNFFKAWWCVLLSYCQDLHSRVSWKREREMINYHPALELIKGLISQLIALLSTNLTSLKDTRKWWRAPLRNV